jgi:uncharacterized RDD family membrane protein YckC
MKIVCPHCNFSREVPDSQIPDHPVKATCPKCQQGFGFDKRAAMAAPAPAATAEPGAAAAASTATAAPAAEPTVCPACGLEQPDFDFCAGCGVVNPKWSARHQEGQGQAPAQPQAERSPALNRVICSACGTVQHPGNQCISCGVVLVAAASTTPPVYQFAGFWIRLVAYLIDTLILGMVQFAIALALGLAGDALTDNGNGELTMALVGGLCGMVVGVTYAVFFTGYNGQTPGKMALRIQVIRSDGTPMSYGRAFLREVIGKLASGIILGIGYLMAGFDRQKQGLHDKIAGTYVIKL